MAWFLPLSPGIPGIPSNSVYHHNLLSDHSSQTDPLLASPPPREDYSTPNLWVKRSLCAEPPLEQREAGWRERETTEREGTAPASNSSRRGEGLHATLQSSTHPPSSLCEKWGRAQAPAEQGPPQAARAQILKLVPGVASQAVTMFCEALVECKPTK